MTSHHILLDRVNFVFAGNFIFSTIQITPNNNIIVMVIKHQKVFFLTGKLASLINLFLGAASLYLVLPKSDIIVYGLLNSELKNLKTKLITYKRNLAIIGESW